MTLPLVFITHQVWVLFIHHLHVSLLHNAVRYPNQYSMFSLINFNRKLLISQHDMSKVKHIGVAFMTTGNPFKSRTPARWHSCSFRNIIPNYLPCTNSPKISSIEIFTRHMRAVIWAINLDPNEHSSEMTDKRHNIAKSIDGFQISMLVNFIFVTLWLLVYYPGILAFLLSFSR